MSNRKKSTTLAPLVIAGLALLVTTFGGRYLGCVGGNTSGNVQPVPMQQPVKTKQPDPESKAKYKEIRSKFKKKFAGPAGIVPQLPRKPIRQKR